MPRHRDEDQELTASLSASLLMAAAVFPRRLLHIEELVREFGLPVSQIISLVLLQHGELTISQLSRQTGIAKPNITPLVDALAERGYVQRRQDTRDKRVIIVCITDAGKACVEQMETAVGRQVSQWYSVSRSELKLLLKSLTTLIRLSGAVTPDK